MTRIAVVDHGAGNLVSIGQGLRHAGADVVVASTPDQLAGAAGTVLPGVGSMAAVMEGISAGGFEEPLAALDVPLLGICVGMQVLFEASEEDGASGLGLLEGQVRRLPAAPRLPHIGWNDVVVAAEDPLFAGLGPAPTFYFVHSFAPEPADGSDVVATTEYGSRFCAAVRRGAIAGVQFHPERSGPAGLRMLANFVARCAGVTRAA